MIDFKKELANFDFMEVDVEFSGYYSETAPLVEAFTTTLKHIGKELNNTNIQLEEVLAQSVEETEKDKQLAQQKKSIDAYEAELLSLVQGLVAALDQFEDIYRYALKNEHDSWFAQIQLLWRNTATMLLPLGLSRIEGEHTLFDPRLHAAAQIGGDNNIPNGMVLEVLRCGYLYQNHLLRKAQVVVNKINGGDTGSE